MVQVKTKRAASIAILSVVSCVLLAQATDYERQAMQYMARIGRGDAVKRSLTIDGGFIRVGFTDGGRLSYSGSTPTIVRYSNTDDTMEAARRSQTEAARLSIEQAEERAWRLLPAGASRSEWRITKSRGFESGMWEGCGNYSFEIGRLYHGVPGAGDRIAVKLDAYDGKVLSLREVSGIEPDEPATRVIPVEEARSIAIRALDRIEDPRTRDQMKRDWASTAPEASQVYSRVGGTLGQYTDPVVATWPLKMRLQWVFAGPGGEVAIDAETGAVLFIGLTMGGGSARPAATTPSASPEETAREPKPHEEEPAALPWLWGLAAIPVAVGAWFVVARSRG